MDIPKIILKIELRSYHGVYITLLNLHDVFLSKFGKTFITDTKWRIIIGSKFQITETLTILPEESDSETYYHHCDNEAQRYNYLKSFSQTLIDLSKDITNEHEENFSDKPYITTQGNMWLIF